MPDTGTRATVFLTQESMALQKSGFAVQEFLFATKRMHCLRDVSGATRVDSSRMASRMEERASELSGLV
jgi:hypothetical protein